LEYIAADGTKLSWQDVEMVGCASAIRPGAGAAFWEERVAYIRFEKLAAVNVERCAKELAAAEAKQAVMTQRAEKFRQACEAKKPVLLDSWVTEKCMNGHDDECSFDRAGEYAMPDVTVKTTYTCCY
jgi:hypothetical protein